MTMCVTGCGAEASPERAPLCLECATVWDLDTCMGRKCVQGIQAEGGLLMGARLVVAIMDFADRVRAERLVEPPK
jgi:hypothetical protein